MMATQDRKCAWLIILFDISTSILQWICTVKAQSTMQEMDHIFAGYYHETTEYHEGLHQIGINHGEKSILLSPVPGPVNVM